MAAAVPVGSPSPSAAAVPSQAAAEEGSGVQEEWLRDELIPAEGETPTDASSPTAAAVQVEDLGGSSNETGGTGAGAYAPTAPMPVEWLRGALFPSAGRVAATGRVVTGRKVAAGGV
eukprot:TRINITY_DN51204_c0_g1_i3.p6 TRINITY_DN51204_c0_g1~~TRINITY_DN51204_c0_g1_i3.p6  ORF type:complete len:117 (-),score=10.85 TRINITY_DN51204_c0_g1_i3:132-482(-)